MKKIIFILFFIIFCTNNSFASNWNEIKSNDEAVLKLFIDKSSIEFQGDFIYYKVKYILNSEEKDENLVWIKSDCEENLTAILNAQKYNPKTEDKFKYTDKNQQMRSFDSTSAMYNTHNAVCNKYKAFAKPVPVPEEKPTKNITKKQTAPKKEINKTPKNPSESDSATYWAPYMKNLEKEIKANWKPPKNDHSIKTVPIEFTFDYNVLTKN